MAHYQTKEVVSFSIQQIGDACGFAPCFPDNLKDLLTKCAYTAKPSGPANAMESWLVIKNEFGKLGKSSKNVMK